MEYLGENGGNIWYFRRKDGAVTSAPIGYFEPLETPAEKAQRLEDEWVLAATDLDEAPALTANAWRRIYRLQLSCKLASPKGGE